MSSTGNGTDGRQYKAVGLWLDEDILAEVDALQESQSWPSRSEAVRKMLRLAVKTFYRSCTNPFK